MVKTRDPSKRKKKGFGRGFATAASILCEEADRKQGNDDFDVGTDQDLTDYLAEVFESEKQVERSDGDSEAMKSSDVTKKHMKRGKAIERNMISILSKVGK